MSGWCSVLCHENVANPTAPLKSCLDQWFNSALDAQFNTKVPLISLRSACQDIHIRSQGCKSIQRLIYDWRTSQRHFALEQHPDLIQPHPLVAKLPYYPPSPFTSPVSSRLLCGAHSNLQLWLALGPLCEPFHATHPPTSGLDTFSPAVCARIRIHCLRILPAVALFATPDSNNRSHVDNIP